jgi:hypothetical protein
MKKLIAICLVAGMLLVLSSTSKAAIITFDGSAGYASIGDLQTAYSAFMGTIDDVITFEEFSPAGSAYPVGDFYLASKGVRFSGEGDNVRIMPANGGAVSGWQQGYVDGKPNDNMVYNKIYNSNPLAALTVVMFDKPVMEIGSFIADSWPTQHTLTVELYDSAGNLLATVNPQVNVWTNGDNTEGYWGVKSDIADIAKIKFVSPSQNYGVTTLDDIGWAVSESVIPEPATMCMLGFGALSLIRRKK